MSPQELNRVDELLADDAIWGLDAAARSELERELRFAEQEFDASWERSAAVATIALQKERYVPPPQSLVDSLRAAAPLPKVPPASVSGWRNSTTNVVLMAALLMLGVAVFWDALTRGGPAISGGSEPGQLRQAILSAGNASVWNWSAETFDGDVVWDGGTQQGAMRFRGLPVNDPAVRQYQLWIFDSERSDAFPVDGGVFNISADNISADNEEAVIIIDPKIVVHDAQAFVITVEAPGGVVVSDRTQVVGQAKPL